MEPSTSYLSNNITGVIIISIHTLPWYIGVATLLKQTNIISRVHERSLPSRVHWVIVKERVLNSVNQLLSTQWITISWSLTLDIILPESLSISPSHKTTTQSMIPQGTRLVFTSRSDGESARHATVASLWGWISAELVSDHTLYIVTLEQMEGVSSL